MKLLCSILILAGIFSLNDASLTFEEQMRLDNDMLMVEQLELLTENRDASSSAECSKIYLEELSDILNIYTSGLNTCDEAKDNTIASLNKDANKLIKSYNKIIQNSCSAIAACLSEEPVLDIITCLESKSSDESSVWSDLSNDAALQDSELQKNLDNAIGTEKSCKTECYASYSRKSDKSNSDFKNCVNGKESDGKTTTTEAPEGTEEPSEDSKEDRPQIRANKYTRW